MIVIVAEAAAVIEEAIPGVTDLEEEAIAMDPEEVIAMDPEEVANADLLVAAEMTATIGVQVHLAEAAEMIVVKTVAEDLVGMIVTVRRNLLNLEVVEAAAEKRMMDGQRSSVKM